MEPKDNSAVENFFNGLPKEDKDIADIFQEEKKPEGTIPEKGGGESGEDDNEPRKNRRHRRLEEKLQQEREANIALNERIRLLTEAERFSQETGGEVDPRLLKVFGTSDEGKELSKIFTDIRAEDRKIAAQQALAEFQAIQERAQSEQREYEKFIDESLEWLEDEHNIDLTSDAPAARKARRELLELVESLSPKDAEGTITGFADFGSTFDLYQRTKAESKSNPTADRRKEISSNSMERPAGSPSGTPKQITPGFHGWKRDYGI